MSSPTRFDPPPRSLAIAPFSAPDDAPELLPIAIGFATELCHALSGTPGLRIASPGATARFAGSAADPVTIGRDLQVETVLAGRLAGDASRPLLDWSLHLVAADRTLDAAVFDTSAATIIDCLRVLVARIGKVLGARPDPAAVDLSLGTGHPGALCACLSARFEFDKQTEAALERAEAGFRRAIELDPDFLGAHVGLFDTFRSQMKYWRRPDPALRRRSDAQLARIRELDPSGMRLNWESLLPDQDDLAFWDIGGHEARRRAALLRNRVDPNTGHSARHAYADLLSESGLFRGAMDYLMQSEAEEPANAHRSALIGRTHALLGDLPAARHWLERCRDLEPHFVLGRTYLITVLQQLGEFDAAARELDAIADDLGPTLTRTIDMGALYWQRRRDELAARVAELDEDPDLPPFLKGLGHLMLEEDAAALDWFEQGWRRNDTFLRQLRESIPFYLGPGCWPRLATQPRFRILLRSLGLDDDWRAEHMRRAELLAPVTGIRVRG